MMSSLKALLFDVDGTLADTENVHREAFNRAFEQSGIDWEWSEALYGQLLAVTGGKERIRHYVTQYQPDFMAEDDLPDFAAKMHKVKTDIYTQMLDGGEVPLRPGVERLLREGRQQGLKLALATTTTLANVEALINNALEPGAMQWFDAVGAGDVVPNKKPAADIYHYVLDELQLSAEQCMAFEDSRNGILASSGANLKTIITVNSYTRNHDFTGAAIVLDHMGEPDRPFTVLSGDAFGHTYLDVELVKKLHAEA
jgi:HAD superfamily hydrolase (TIGR01509 family)